MTSDGVATKPARGRATSAGRRREQAILDAATQIFFDKGYADASVQDVADVVGDPQGGASTTTSTPKKICCFAY